uniref:Uncharacterized protein n=1 Tax=Rhodococcus aetherivorans I24 TaxID=1036179 RepID=Q157F2_9NOCA|nr:hypothetical protein [Rhodococcus aetherivorans]ABG29061.1 conserved hypothetical protein [Rhodococcus aetherivorans I24]
MTTPRKPPADATPQVKSRWQEMRDKARANAQQIPPYVFDGTEPPTLITMPDTVERSIAMAEFAREGMQRADMRGAFKVLLGDSFDAVWSVIANEHATVIEILFNDITDHFYPPE